MTESRAVLAVVADPVTFLLSSFTNKDGDDASGLPGSEPTSGRKHTPIAALRFVAACSAGSRTRQLTNSVSYKRDAEVSSSETSQTETPVEVPFKMRFKMRFKHQQRDIDTPIDVPESAICLE